jgi:arginine decarboxylase
MSCNELKQGRALGREEALRAFKLGVLSLNERAQLEILFDATCARICHLAASVGTFLPEGLQQSGRPAANVYHANFSGALH